MLQDLRSSLDDDRRERFVAVTHLRALLHKLSKFQDQVRETPRGAEAHVKERNAPGKGGPSKHACLSKEDGQ